MLREISETEKDKYHMTSLICEIKKKKKDTHTQNLTQRYREQIGGCQRWCGYMMKQGER